MVTHHKHKVSSDTSQKATFTKAQAAATAS